MTVLIGPSPRSIALAKAADKAAVADSVSVASTLGVLSVSEGALKKGKATTTLGAQVLTTNQTYKLRVALTAALAGLLMVVNGAVACRHYTTPADGAKVEGAVQMGSSLLLYASACWVSSAWGPALRSKTSYDVLKECS